MQPKSLMIAKRRVAVSQPFPMTQISTKCYTNDRNLSETLCRRFSEAP